jgi:hypothetical protein
MMTITKIRRRLHKAMLEYGLIGTIGRLAIWPLLFIGWRLRECLPFDRNRRKAGEEYDRLHGVDTIRDRSTEWSADIDSENLGAGTGYAATPPDTVRISVRSLTISPEEYVFIDLGSGKGRVMLVASEVPFKECLGVEYAPDLHEVAVRNIASFNCPDRKCPVIKSICHDAATFPLPDSPLVLFFAHPFGGEVLKGFLLNLQQSLRKNPRKVFVIYYDPICRDEFLDAGFRQIGSHDLPRFNSFRNRLGKEFVILENHAAAP